MCIRDRSGPTGAGEKGQRGYTGLQGLTGPSGPTGAGEKGQRGYTGLQGLTGPSGPTGAGEKGQRGEDGQIGQEGPTGPTGPASASSVMNSGIEELPSDYENMVSVNYHQGSGTIYQDRQSTGVYVTIPDDKSVYIAKDADGTAYIWVYIRNSNYNGSSNDNILTFTPGTPTQPPGLWKIVALTSTYGGSNSSFTTLANSSLPVFD